MFGVNRRSSLTYFDVTSGTMIPDVMHDHDFLDGVIPLELKLMLKVYACVMDVLAGK